MKQKPFTIYAWSVLAVPIGVILWGAYVRATGSGAGCGNHWPACNGVIIPRGAQIKTIIEFTHRLTSGFSGVLVLIMLVWAFRLYAPGHIVRQGAGLSTCLIIAEGIIGAGLVRLELVAHNDSALRAVAIAVHLTNTFLLLAALVLTAWWAGGGRPIQLRNQGRVGRLLAAGFLGMLILGATGAITALGDTLFPVATFAAGIQQDLSPTAHFLVRLRIWHPVIALILGLYLIHAGRMIGRMRPNPDSKRFARALILLFLIQLAAGALNLILNVPIFMQMIHLLLADLVWITFVLLAAVVLTPTTVKTEASRLATQAGD